MKKKLKQQLKEELALDNMDWKELFNLTLNLIEKHNKKLSLKELKDEYNDYFEYDLIKSIKSKKEFLELCIQEEENYKIEYNENELKECIKCMMGYNRKKYKVSFEIESNLNEEQLINKLWKEIDGSCNFEVELK